MDSGSMNDEIPTKGGFTPVYCGGGIMEVKITEGEFVGEIGRLTYGDDGSEWVTFWTADGWRDVQAKYEAVK